MPELEQTPAPNQLYRYSLSGATVGSRPLSLAEFWTMYKQTFGHAWNGTEFTPARPRDATVTLIAPWGEVQLYPLPDAIGHTRRASIQAHLDAGRSQCSQCHTWHADTETVTLDGDPAACCPDCLDGLSTCDRCDEHCTATHTVDGDDWCESCRDNHATRCDDCRDYFADTDNGLTHRSDWYCESCAEEYSTCEECGTLLSRDNQHYDENSGNTYCERHAPSEDEEENSLIHDYSYKPRPIFHGAGIHYGVELEITCDPDTAEGTLDQLGGESHAYLKQDSSIEGGGYEIVTHPHTLDAHRKLWDNFNAHARRHSFKANGNGMHVHIERSKLTPYRIAVMQRFINHDENRAFIHSIAQRDNSSWAACKSELAKMRKDGDGQRYSALNLNNSKTVELRIFRGTYRKSEFFKNLEFCDALVHWTVDRSHAHTSVPDFTAYVRTNRKSYPALDAFLVDRHYLPAIPVDVRPKGQLACA